MLWRRGGRGLLALMLLALFLSGCARTPYVFGGLQQDRNLQIDHDQPQIEVGRSNKLLDLLGNIWSLPAKLLLWDKRVGSHRVSQETIDKLSYYLEQNDLKNVKVRVNQYAPGAEWRRLFRNDSVHIFWRASLGVLSTSLYTILPGRVFGSDNYNPYTNTLSLYSDHSAIALHEGGHAKDLFNHENKGLYSAAYAIPGLSLWHEAQATGDTIGYLQTKGDKEGERAAYKILYPAYGTYLGGMFSDLLPIDLGSRYLLLLGTVVPGHIVGQIKAAGID